MTDKRQPKRTLALGTPETRPAWLRVTDGERHWWVGLAVLVAIAVHLVVPRRFDVGLWWLIPSIELVLLVIAAATHAETMAQRKPWQRAMAQVQYALIAVWNATSLVLLVRGLTDGSHISPHDLLLGGLSVWLTNVIVFSLWYWDFDRGGPAARAAGTKDIPDLLFPQMTDDHLAHDWEPEYLDYLYVSYTNATAFSPTDTMPLSRWVKALFTVQSITALLTITLVAARAVNILPT